MTHEEYVAMRRNKEPIRSNMSAAGFLFGMNGLLSNNSRNVQAVLRSLFFLALVGGLASFIFIKWYFAFGIILCAGMLARLGQIHALQTVLKEAESKPLVFEAAIIKGAIIE